MPRNAATPVIKRQALQLEPISMQNVESLSLSNQNELLSRAGTPITITKRLALQLHRVASFNSVSEHTTLFEHLHDKVVHVAGKLPANLLTTLRAMHCQHPLYLPTLQR